MKIIDLHCDAFMQVMNNPQMDIYHKDGHINLEKMQKGGYLLQCFAMFINMGKTNEPFKAVIEMIDCYYQNINKYPQYIKPVYSYQDLKDNIQNNLMSALLTVEEGGVLEGKLSYLRILHQLGVRMITLTWNYPNEIGYPNIDMTKISEYKDKIKTMIDNEYGLTPKGIEIIKAMEELGIIIDVSHLGDKGVRDVLKYTTRPFVASHSNARTVCDFPRNLPDDLLLAMKERGCLIGINYCPDFVKENANKMVISDLIEHIDYLKHLIGIDCICLGSDFDGISGNLELKDASELPKLVQALLEHGYTTEEVKKITSENALKFFEKVL